MNRLKKIIGLAAKFELKVMEQNLTMLLLNKIFEVHDTCNNNNITF